MVGNFGIQPGVRVLAIAVAMIIAMVFSQMKRNNFSLPLSVTLGTPRNRKTNSAA